ncbi:dihydrofolate reductase [Kribbella voronezhensis]|uniref:Dihydrofolate reductase n=1 Tax=Kribbella voronezhensis TaxID=2512212 RepID=A0A4R7TDN0_9ACTN|nr:dihydrofolate reductase family protein [Kribbella voronezhensis]TDU89616.1 dihydrofolate reductase [Kribbella voronezhensis]
MRDLVVTENITVDGVIEATEGWFGPADGDMSDQLAEIRKQQAGADAFLVGRQTFEDLRGYWPNQTDDETGISAYLDNVAKYVVSSSLQDPEWKNSTVLRDLGAVSALKDAPGKDIVTTGSIDLVHQLIAAGLVDEFRLFIYPVVLGHGRRLFPSGVSLPTLHLVDTKTFKSGVSLTRYRA